MNPWHTEKPPNSDIDGNHTSRFLVEQDINSSNQIDRWSNTIQASRRNYITFWSVQMEQDINCVEHLTATALADSLWQFLAGHEIKILWWYNVLQ